MTATPCPRCKAPRREGTVFCPACGFNFAGETFAEGHGAAPIQAPPATQAKIGQSRFWVLLFVVGLALWGWSQIYSDGAGNPDTPPTARSPAPPAAWWPSGFTPMPQNVSLASRWMATSEFECTYSTGACLGMVVIAESGCDSLYVELSLLDADGAVVGWTNDTASGLRAGERAKLVFEIFDEGAVTGRVSQVSCY